MSAAWRPPSSSPYFFITAYGKPSTPCSCCSRSTQARIRFTRPIKPSKLMSSYCGCRIPDSIRGQPARWAGIHLAGSGSMISLKSWWWPKRPVRVPRAGTAVLLAGLGAVLFGVAAVLLKTGTLSWDESLFRLLNDVPSAAASVLTPLSKLFLPLGIAIVIVLIIGYVLVRDRSILPVVAGVAAAAVA